MLYKEKKYPNADFKQVIDIEDIQMVLMIMNEEDFYCCLQALKSLYPSLQLTYQKYYLTFWKDGLV